MDQKLYLCIFYLRNTGDAWYINLYFLQRVYFYKTSLQQFFCYSVLIKVQLLVFHVKYNIQQQII